MSNTTPYISIKSVLYDISTLLDAESWDEEKMTEWAIRGYKKLDIGQKFQEKVCVAVVANHKAQLPTDLHGISQIGARATTNNSIATLKACLGLESPSINTGLEHMTFLDSFLDKIVTSDISNGGWSAMLPATNTMFNTVACGTGFTITDNSCRYEYSINPSMTLTTNLKDGYILISYLAYVEDEDGNTLIPNNSTLKEALMHFCMYRYWLSKSSMHEQGAAQNRNFHLEMWESQAQKAKGELNKVTLGILENIRNQQLNLVERGNAYNDFFATLNKPKHLRP